MQRNALASVILAAGKGARMKSPMAKVLHPLSSKPLLAYVLDTVFALNPARVVVVVGYQSEQVIDQFRDPRVEFVEQKELKGTGHAVLQTQTALKGFAGNLLVLCGDMPLIKPSTLKKLVAHHEATQSRCTLLTLKIGEPKDFGRILRNEAGKVIGIIENSDASPTQKTIDEYSTGVYCFEKDLVFEAIRHIDNNNSQAEFYLTDTIHKIAQNHLVVQSVQTKDAEEIFGINCEEDLKNAERILTGHSSC
ncbi:MAG: NTP transferase domain-containing protein [Nitrospinota bacterium]|nr:NTP transferase domain-containing protein [Nitrospinota bacterium]